MRYIFLLALALFISFPQGLYAVNPRLSNGVELLAGGSSPTPCQTAAACSANVGAEIVYEQYSSADHCAEIWSMNVNGGNRVNLTAKMFTNGFGFGPSFSQGIPKYSPNGQWILFYMEGSGSSYACTDHAVFSGAATDGEIGVCDTATYSNCAVVRSITAGLGEGCLHPQWSRDGNYIVYGLWYGHFSAIQEGNTGKLQWASFVPGTPPSLGTIYPAVDPGGDGNGDQNWYEPWDSDGAIGTPTCWFYMTSDTIPNSMSYANVGIARYSIGGTGCPAAGTWQFVSSGYESPTGCYSEFWAFTAAHPNVALTVTGCPYAGQAWTDAGYSVLNVVMAMGDNGLGATQLTYYNLTGSPEFAYPSLASSPRWSYDGSYIVFSVTFNTNLQGQLAGYPGSTGTNIWKYKVNFVPSQLTGLNSLNGISVTQ